MADRRTVREFAAEIEHITGVRIRIRWIPFGLFLEDTETGRYYSLGWLRRTRS